MNINDIMLQGDAGSGTTEASSKYYNVGKNNAATADAGYLGIRSKAVQTDFMMPQLQGLRESGSENYTGRQATEIAADRVQNDNAASRNLKVVTGEDCAALEDEDSALEEYQKSSLERAVKRIREEREWKADRMEENKELREQLANDLEKMQQQGFLAQKSEAQIRDALQEANLPATKEFVDKVAGTLQMSMSINEMTDAAKVYVIQNGTQPTKKRYIKECIPVVRQLTTHRSLRKIWRRMHHRSNISCSRSDEGELRIKRWQSGCLQMNCRSRLRICRH